MKKLTRQLEHWKQCEEDLHDPNFNLQQEVINKSLEIVHDELQTKQTLRNYSAMNLVSKRKMQHQIMSESTVTEHEKARLAHKLLVNFSKNLKFQK